MSGIYRDLGPNLMRVGDERERLEVGTRDECPIWEDEYGALARLNRCKIAVHGLYRAEGWLGGRDGQGEGLTGCDSDLQSMGGSCPKEDGAIGGLNCVRTLMGV